jgi:hypothetical protein
MEYIGGGSLEFIAGYVVGMTGAYPFYQHVLIAGRQVTQTAHHFHQFTSLSAFSREYPPYCTDIAL